MGKDNKMGKDLKLLREYFPIFNLIAHTDKRTRNCLMNHLDVKACKALFLLIEKIFEKNDIKLDEKTLIFLRKNVPVKHQKRFITCSNKKMSVKKKKQNVVQTGGSLALILGTIIPLLSQLFK